MHTNSKPALVAWSTFNSVHFIYFNVIVSDALGYFLEILMIPEFFPNYEPSLQDIMVDKAMIKVCCVYTSLNN